MRRLRPPRTAGAHAPPEVERRLDDVLPDVRHDLHAYEVHAAAARGAAARKCVRRARTGRAERAPRAASSALAVLREKNQPVQQLGKPRRVGICDGAAQDFIADNQERRFGGGLGWCACGLGPGAQRAAQAAWPARRLRAVAAGQPRARVECIALPLPAHPPQRAAARGATPLRPDRGAWLEPRASSARHVGAVANECVRVRARACVAAPHSASWIGSCTAHCACCWALNKPFRRLALPPASPRHEHERCAGGPGRAAAPPHHQGALHACMRVLRGVVAGPERLRQTARPVPSLASQETQRLLSEPGAWLVGGGGWRRVHADSRRGGRRQGAELHSRSQPPASAPRPPRTTCATSMS